MNMGALTRDEMDALLRAQTVAHVGCQGDGRPYVLPLNYAWDGEAIYVHALAGRKIDLMRAHPLVCVQVDDIVSSVNWQSVVGWGLYDELHRDAASRALSILVERLGPPNPNGQADPFVPPILAERVVMFRVQLDELTGRFMRP
jgi:nitroimidazol reductase NimA-like FMN-containing flavoprotein (pyridoxamine 5'-phosphate oxidase superfamily)